MTEREKDRLECAVRHIRTAANVDPWAMELAVDALEKQIPKRPVTEEDECIVKYRCARCGNFFGQRGKHSVALFDRPAYCSCGQAQDWAEN